jgi:thiosulfate/3-mercaptopyruvate sulfurtransferase
LVLLIPAVFVTSVQPAACASIGANTAYAHPDWLVSAAWLKRHIKDPDIKLVALTSKSDFAKAHIPGATQIDWQDLGLTDTSPASVARWRVAVEQKLTKLGVNRRDKVVIYDGGTLFAARLWWVFDDLGQMKPRILDGGLAAWTADGGKVEQGAAIVPPEVKPYEAAPYPADLATLDEVKASLGQKNVTIIDARTEAEYMRGHIPGAININYEGNALPGSPRFWKSAPVLQQLYAHAGVKPKNEIIAYCSTGVRSAVTAFTLRLIGYPDVRLYTGSWAEWSRHPDLPTAKGLHP